MLLRRNSFIILSLLWTLHVALTNARCGGRKLAGANAKFALNMCNELEKEEDGNIFFSPLSISLAMGMTLLGARGNTSTQMKDAMSLARINDRNIHKSFGQLSGCLQRTGNCTSDIANRLFPEKTFKLLKRYINQSKRFYKAEPMLVDFKNNADTARKTINTWVEDQTNKKIRDLIPKRDVNALTVLVLVNAIYFKCDWLYEFKKKNTMDRDFYLTPQNTVKVPMMHMKSDLKYGVSAELDCKILELPYKDKKFSMFILLPNKKNGVGMLKSKLQTKHLRDPVNVFNMYETEVMVRLPKFKLEQSFNLENMLMNLGMQDLFTGAANLSGMDGCEGCLAVSKVIHKAFINVDEKGTEAAAATAVVIFRYSPRHSLPLQFYADRPFLFMIRDNDAKSVLFLGRLMKP